MIRRLSVLSALAVFLVAFSARGEAPSELAAHLEEKMAAGDGIMLPDANLELVRFAGTVDLARGDWPESFVARSGETICVAVSPLTGY